MVFCFTLVFWGFTFKKFLELNVLCNLWWILLPLYARWNNSSYTYYIQYCRFYLSAKLNTTEETNKILKRDQVDRQKSTNDKGHKCQSTGKFVHSYKNHNQLPTSLLLGTTPLSYGIIHHGCFLQKLAAQPRNLNYCACCGIIRSTVLAAASEYYRLYAVYC